MKLDAVIIEGFRGYAARQTIAIDQLTAFVGQNDVGKSTILEALDAFFNEEADAQDLNTLSTSKKFTIGCVFSGLPDSIHLDATSPTTLAGEYLLNQDGKLEIYKTWKCTASKAEIERVYAVAHAPGSEQLRDLLFKKRDDLRAVVDGLGSDVNRNRNPDMRAAIYQHYSSLNQLELQNREVDLDRPKDKVDTLEDARKILKKLSDRHLPVYTLFKSEQVKGDKESAVRSPLDATLKAAIKLAEAALGPIAEQIESAVKDTTERTLERLRRDYPDVARNLKPEYKSPSWSKAFDLDVLRGDDDVPLNKRGAGIRRLVVLAFFQAEAEKKRGERADGASAPPVIYAIEEPETSQHPDFQRAIIRAFSALAASGDQVLVTTHVPGIAALLPTESIRLVVRGANGIEVLSGSDDVFEKVVDALGVMPDRRAQVAVFVEGPNDVEFLCASAKLHHQADGSLLDLEDDYRVAFVPTGGGNLKHWVEKRYLQNAKLAEVHIYDADDQAAPKYKAHVDAVNARANGDIGFLTGKRELENYIHADAIQQVLNCTVSVSDWNDVPDLVAEQVYVLGGGHSAWVGLDEKKRGQKVSRAKYRLNREVVSAMSLEQLGQMDPGGEIRIWLEAIRDRCS